MKRQGCLIEKITDLDNLYLAFYKAQQGKSVKKQIVEYAKNLQANLLKLGYQIESGTVETGNYHYFTIYDPKQRLICAAPFDQRVLHHALMNVCHPFFEKVQIFHSYACRKNKGTFAALNRAAAYTRQVKWFLKLDFRKYFDSIDQSVLKQQLDCLFKDRKLLSILDSIIDSYCITKNKGLPIGNLTSQYFANHYLAQADHFIKEKLQVKAYVRYMDDLALWHNDKEFLKKAAYEIKDFTAKNLKLQLKPFCLNYQSKGLPFLGYVLFPDKIRLSRNSVKRFKHKLELYNNYVHFGMWSQKEYQNHILPLIAFTEYAHARQLRREIIEKCEHAL